MSRSSQNIENLPVVEEDVSSAHTSTLGRYLSLAGNHPILPDEEVTQLVMAAKLGDLSARNRLILHNQRLIIGIAARFATGQVMMDAIQEGNVALVNAIKSYDHEFGVPFATYAWKQIRFAVWSAINSHKRAVHLPAYIPYTISIVERLERELSVKLGRDPSPEELEVVVRDANIRSPAVFFRVKKWSEFSLDDSTCISSGRGASVCNHGGHNLVAQDQLRAHELLNELIEQVKELLDVIDDLSWSDRRKKVFFSYYGLRGYELGNTYETVGESLGVSKQAIQQQIVTAWKGIKLHGPGIKLDHVSLPRVLEAICEFSYLASGDHCL